MRMEMQSRNEAGIHPGVQNNKKRLTAVIAALLAVVVLLVSIPMIRARAVVNDSNSVSFRTFKSRNTIEDSTLFIGTHLIHISALTDELYKKAQDSVSDSNQSEIYYKSELAGGVWVNITSAKGLADISTTAQLVDESELDDLRVTYYTGSDGITRNAMTGSAACLYDDPDPYDLLKLPELDTVRQVYENKYYTEEEGLHKYFYTILTSFFATNVRNEKTNECDKALKSLQKCYESYQLADNKEFSQILSTLMDKVDATRRTEVFYQLCGGDRGRVDILFDSAAGTHYEEGDYDDEPFVPDEVLIDAISNSLSACMESYTEYSANQLDNGSTQIRKYIYEQCMKLVDLCEAAGGANLSTNSDVVSALTQIKHAMNIEQCDPQDREGELALIEQKFMPELNNSFSSGLHAGVSQEYAAARSANKSDTAKKQILKDDLVDLDVLRTDLQFMITAETDRKDSAAALEFTYERIAWAEDQRNGIKNDEFKDYAELCLQDHIDWLQDLAKQIIEGDASLMSELDKLKDQLQDYLDKQEAALDDGNLDLATQFESMADAIQGKISDEEARLNAILNSDTASAQEKAQAAASLGESSLLGNINKFLNDALSALNSGDMSTLNNKMNTLSAIGAENALNQIKDALDGSGLSDDDKDAWNKKLSDAINESKNSSLHDVANAGGAGTNSGTDGAGGAGANSGTDGAGGADGNSGTDGAGGADGNDGTDGAGNGAGSGTSGTGNPAKLTKSELLNLIEQILGGSFDTLDAEGQLAVTVALDWLGSGEYSNAAAYDLSAVYARQCQRNQNPYLYNQYGQDKATDYIPLSVIADAVGYRYVYSDSRQVATLAKGASNYEFTVGSKKYKLTDGTEKEMSKATVFQNLPYVCESVAKDCFSCEAEYINNMSQGSFGACLTPKIKAVATEVYNAFTGK